MDSILRFSRVTGMNVQAVLRPRTALPRNMERVVPYDFVAISVIRSRSSLITLESQDGRAFPLCAWQGLSGRPSWRDCWMVVGRDDSDGDMTALPWTDPKVDQGLRLRLVRSATASARRGH